MTVKQCDESMGTGRYPIVDGRTVYKNGNPYRVVALKGASGLVEIIPWGDSEIVDAEELSETI